MAANSGVLFFNEGRKMLMRLAVACHSLRKFYSGPATIIVGDLESRKPCEKIAKRFGLQAQAAHFRTPRAKNATYLNKTLLHEVTPYDLSVFLDSDTVTVAPGIESLFARAEESEFLVPKFATWKVSRKIAKRVRQWEGIIPDSWIASALEYPAAINTGVFAFRRDSEFMASWWKWASQGQANMIPDETSCQAMIAEFPHCLISAEWNTSCKYGEIEGAKIIHFHGRKHCRFETEGEGKDEVILSSFRYNSDIWYRELEELRPWKLIDRFKGKDRQLKKYLPKWDEVKESVNA